MTEDYAIINEFLIDGSSDISLILSELNNLFTDGNDHYWEVEKYHQDIVNDLEIHTLLLKAKEKISSSEDFFQKIIIQYEELDEDYCQFRFGYDPAGSINFDDNMDEFDLSSSTFSGLSNFQGSSKLFDPNELEVVDSNLLKVFGYDTKIRIAEHVTNDCSSPCVNYKAAALSILIEDVTESNLIFGVHIGRVLRTLNLNDNEHQIYGDALLIGYPTNPLELKPDDHNESIEHTSWLGQTVATSGSLVRCNTTIWKQAIAVGHGSGMPDHLYHPIDSKDKLRSFSIFATEDFNDNHEKDKWIKIIVGHDHTVAIKQDGTLWTWGNNNSGQLGIGTFGGEVLKPIQIGDENTWLDIAAGNRFTVAIKKEQHTNRGSLWTWGLNNKGQLGVGDQYNRPHPTKIGNNHDWKSVSAKYDHVLAIRMSSTAMPFDNLWAWGDNSYGQLGLGDTFNRNAPSLVSEDSWLIASAGKTHSLCIKRKFTPGIGFGSFGSHENYGTLWSCGSPETGLANTLLGRTVDGSNPSSRLRQIGSYDQWKLCNAGVTHSIAIQHNTGNMFSWGFNDWGQLGLGDTFNRNSPVQILSGESINWKTAIASDRSSFAIADNNKVWAWGKGNYLGFNVSYNLINNPSINSTYEPINWTLVLPDEEDILKQSYLAINVGNTHGTAISEAGELFTWGNNANGQLGLNNNDNKIEPTFVKFKRVFNGSVFAGEIGKTKYIRQIGTSSLDYDILFSSETPGSQQAWLSIGNVSNQVLLWKKPE
jgi:alpha-tubulin suppressor-like RCC1 family protein